MPRQPNTNQSTFSHVAVLASWGLIGLGVVLRLRQYFSGRSLWVDEAMLALNILGHDFVGLLKPLDYQQGAPIAFLLTEKLVTTLIGGRELALRLFPLLTGCLALVVFSLIVRRLLKPAGALAALGLFAVNPRLIYYASEVKQYSSDVCVVLILFWLALNVFDAKPRSKVILTIAGIFALWFSHPAFFVLAAIGTVLLLDAIRKRERRALLETFAIGTAWLTSFGLLYLVSLRQLASDSFLIEYWRDSFGLNPLDAMLNLFPSAAGLDAYAPALLIISIVGLIFLFIKQPKTAGILTLIFAFTLFASWLQKYPFSGRLMLFSVPLLSLLLGACSGWLASLPLRPKWISLAFSLALTIWLLSAPAQTSFNQYVSPAYDEHIRPALASLQENYQPGDTIYVYYWAIPAFRYYAPMYNLQDTDFIEGQDAGLSELLAELAPLKTHKRVWVLFSHLTRKGLEKRDAVLASLGENHKQAQKYILPGTNVYLYLYTAP